MESVEETSYVGAEIDDDDYGHYFLQPAESPYIIAEKVKEANTALFSEDISFDNKEPRVKFKEDLVDYEPEYSYDETSSIESEENIDYSLMEHDTTILESQLQQALILNVCNTDDEEDLPEISEEIPDEVTPTTASDSISFNIQYETVTVKQLSDEMKNEKAKEEKEVNKMKKTKFFRKFRKIEEISCRKHCVDNIDYFDFNANICVSKINLREKPYQCPRLKLQRRNCCEKNEVKIQQKLPCYSGLRSEYGLSAAQLEKRERRKQILKMKELERQRLIEENKRRRIEQNEQIFCEWLKEVSSRKNQKKPDIPRPRLSSTVITFSGKSEANKERPKTAHEIMPKTNMKKKRPNTSSTCVFIEVPPSVLQKGINIGDLLVARSSKLSPKKLHLVTVS